MLDLDKLADKLSMILTAALIASFTLLPETIYGYTIFGILLVAIFLLKTKGIFSSYINAYFVLQALMIVFTAASLSWAEVPYWTSIKVRQLTVNLGFSYLLYIAYSHEKNIWPLIKSFKWAGYFVAFYLILYYGINGILMMLMNSVRMDSTEVANANSLGMGVAWGCFFEFLEMAHYKKLNLSSLMLIPSILVMSSTQSRKAILILVIGVVLIYWLYYIHSGNYVKSLVGICLFVALAGILVRFFKSSPLFSGIYRRIEYLLNFFNDEGEVGASVVARELMIQAGWLQFLEKPILGIGIGNAGLAGRVVGVSEFWAYLHNNYIELLCGGGIIGFSIYYARYVYILWKLWQNRHSEEDSLYPCIIVFIIKVIIDYALVTYFEKPYEIDLILLFLTFKYIEDPRPVINQPIKEEHRYKYIKG